MFRSLFWHRAIKLVVAYSRPVCVLIVNFTPPLYDTTESIMIFICAAKIFFDNPFQSIQYIPLSLKLGFLIWIFCSFSCLISLIFLFCLSYALLAHVLIKTHEKRTVHRKPKIPQAEKNFTRNTERKWIEINNSKSARHPLVTTSVCSNSVQKRNHDRKTYFVHLGLIIGAIIKEIFAKTFSFSSLPSRQFNRATRICSTDENR